MFIPCIIPGKCSRALAAQAPKVEGGHLHREGAILAQGPPRMRS